MTQEEEELRQFKHVLSFAATLYAYYKNLELEEGAEVIRSARRMKIEQAQNQRTFGAP